MDQRAARIPWREAKDTGNQDSGALPLSIQNEPKAAVALLRALRNTAVSVFYQDPELRFLWARNIPESWNITEVAGATDSDLLPNHIAERVTAAKRAVLATHEPERFEVSFPGADGIKWFDLWIDPDLDADGELMGMITTAVEITEQKRREQTLRTLLREVSHRSRNLLAIIQSIATQTGRFSATIDQFLIRFRGRLQSLAASQDLVTLSNWRGASLRELVMGQAARYSLTPASSVRFSGANPWLNPNAALHIGLALHELSVNSVSFGALSRPGGFVTVTAVLSALPLGQPSLCLEWSETIGTPTDLPPNDPVRERRFGSVALEQVVPASLNGEAKLEIGAGLLNYRLTIPSGNFEAE
jgi:two-component sensor histidine kinase